MFFPILELAIFCSVLTRLDTLDCERYSWNDVQTCGIKFLIDVKMVCVWGCYIDVNHNVNERNVFSESDSIYLFLLIDLTSEQMNKRIPSVWIT